MPIIGPAATRFAHFVGFRTPKAERKPMARQLAPAVAPTRKPAVRERASSDHATDLRAELEGTGPIADARRRERARCQAIISAGMIAGELDLAKSLAFDTTESERDAIAFINSRGASQQPDARKARSWTKALRLAANGRSTPLPPNQSSWDDAFDRVTKPGN